MGYTQPSVGLCPWPTYGWMCLHNGPSVLMLWHMPLTWPPTVAFKMGRKWLVFKPMCVWPAANTPHGLWP